MKHANNNTEKQFRMAFTKEEMEILLQALNASSAMYATKAESDYAKGTGRVEEFRHLSETARDMRERVFGKISK